MLVKSCPQRRPAANINETNAAAPFRRAFYAVSGGQERPTRFYRSAAKTDEQRCANRYGFTSISKPAVLSPLNNSAQAERRRCSFGTASMLFRQRPRAPPAAARTRQHKQADKRRRAISLRLPYRFGGGQGYIPTPRRRSSSVKSRTGIDLPILHGNAAVPKAAVRPSPPTPPNDGTKKDRTSTAVRSCIEFLWLALRSPRPAGDGGLRPLSGSGNPKAAKRRSLVALLFRSPAPNARRAKSFFDRRRTGA